MSSSNPQDLESGFFAALTLYREGHTAEALEKLIPLTELKPPHEDAYEALSVILYNEKRYDESIAVLKRWIAANPNTIMAHTNLSRCYVAKGMILEAEHEQAEARKLTWKAELKEKKQAMPKVDFEEKIARYKQIIELDPADVLGYFSLATVYADAGKKREALDTFEKAVAVNPQHTSSYLGLGQALEALGDLEKAAEVYAKGIKVGEAHGDMMPQKKMESLLRSVEAKKALKLKPPDGAGL